MGFFKNLAGNQNTEQTNPAPAAQPKPLTNAEKGISLAKTGKYKQEFPQTGNPNMDRYDQKGATKGEFHAAHEVPDEELYDYGYLSDMPGILDYHKKDANPGGFISEMMDNPIAEYVIEEMYPDIFKGYWDKHMADVKDPSQKGKIDHFSPEAQHEYDSLREQAYKRLYDADPKALTQFERGLRKHAGLNYAKDHPVKE